METGLYGQPLCIYGDPAYPVRVHLQFPYHHGQLTNAQKAFNTLMSSVRIAVEWVFGDIVNHFGCLDFNKNLKIGHSPVGKIHLPACMGHQLHPPIIYELIRPNLFKGWIPLPTIGFNSAYSLDSDL